MTAPAITIPDTVPPEWATKPDDGDGGDGPVTHRTCCDPEVALCGDPVADAEEVDRDDDSGETCAICERIDELELPCGTRFCRLRRWIRDRKTS